MRTDEGLPSGKGKDGCGLEILRGQNRQEFCLCFGLMQESNVIICAQELNMMYSVKMENYQMCLPDKDVYFLQCIKN